VKYGSDTNGYVDYVKGANIAGFVKVADAMLAQGWCKFFRYKKPSAEVRGFFFLDRTK
jgi:hypothetical protein